VTFPVPCRLWLCYTPATVALLPRFTHFLVGCATRFTQHVCPHTVLRLPRLRCSTFTVLPGSYTPLPRFGSCHTVCRTRLDITHVYVLVAVYTFCTVSVCRFCLHLPFRLRTCRFPVTFWSLRLVILPHARLLPLLPPRSWFTALHTLPSRIAARAVYWILHGFTLRFALPFYLYGCSCRTLDAGRLVVWFNITWLRFGLPPATVCRSPRFTVVPVLPVGCQHFTFGLLYVTTVCSRICTRLFVTCLRLRATYAFTLPTTFGYVPRYSLIYRALLHTLPYLYTFYVTMRLHALRVCLVTLRLLLLFITLRYVAVYVYFTFYATHVHAFTLHALLFTHALRYVAFVLYILLRVYRCYFAVVCTVTHVAFAPRLLPRCRCLLRLLRLALWILHGWFTATTPARLRCLPRVRAVTWLRRLRGCLYAHTPLPTAHVRTLVAAVCCRWFVRLRIGSLLPV